MLKQTDRQKKLLFLGIGIGMAAILIALIFVIARRPPKSSVLPPPLPPSALQWKDIKMGQDNKTQVEVKLGPPLSTKNLAENKEVSTYQSSNQYWPHEVEYVNGIATLVKQRQLHSKKFELFEYAKKYGQPEKIVPTKDSGFGIDLYIYTKKGFALKAHRVEGEIFEIWHFQPTTLEDFLQKYSQEIGTDPTQGSRF